MIVVSRQAFFEAKFRVLHYEKNGRDTVQMVSGAAQWNELKTAKLMQITTTVPAHKTN